MTRIVEIYRRFPAKEDCLAHLEAVRWPSGPTCPYCGADRVSHNRDRSRGLTASRWKCQRCMRSFSVTVGTIFHNSHIDLQLWFLLIVLMLSAKKGLSAMQAARDLETRRPTVWSMMHRVRRAMVDDGKLLAGIVEMDETYIGGKEANKHAHKKLKAGRGTVGKAAVIGMRQRGGRTKAQTVAGTDAATLQNGNRCYDLIGLQTSQIRESTR